MNEFPRMGGGGYEKKLTTKALEALTTDEIDFQVRTRVER
jgi:hypothetical protein